MKNLSVSLLLTMSLSTLAQAASSQMSWDDIFESPIYKVHSPSVNHPDGASLFNVCLERGQFRVINPEPECAETQTVTVGMTMKDAYTVEKCVAYAPVADVVRVPTYTIPCANYKEEKTPGLMKDAVSTFTCVEYGEPEPVAVEQMIEVYRDTNNEVFAFEKEYKIPRCADLGIMDIEPVPPKK